MNCTVVKNNSAFGYSFNLQYSFCVEGERRNEGWFRMKGDAVTPVCILHVYYIYHALATLRFMYLCWKQNVWFRFNSV